MSLAIYTSAAWTANGGITVSAGDTVEVRTYGSGRLMFNNASEFGIEVTE